MSTNYMRVSDFRSTSATFARKPTANVLIDDKCLLWNPNTSMTVDGRTVLPAKLALNKDMISANQIHQIHPNPKCWSADVVCCLSRGVTGGSAGHVSYYRSRGSEKKEGKKERKKKYCCEIRNGVWCYIWLQVHGCQFVLIIMIIRSLLHSGVDVRQGKFLCKFTTF